MPKQHKMKQKKLMIRMCKQKIPEKNRVKSEDKKASEKT